MTAQDPTTGCLGCASGKGSGAKNVFGNKYGQNLAAVQIAREKRMKIMQEKREEQARKLALQQQQQEKYEEDKNEIHAQDFIPNEKNESSGTTEKTLNNAGDSETDDDDDEVD